ncbi:MAG: hypothetical protein ACPGO3_05430 [Magnetospiraceae bacterium]
MTSHNIQNANVIDEMTDQISDLRLLTKALYTMSDNVMVEIQSPTLRQQETLERAQAADALIRVIAERLGRLDETVAKIES